MLRIYKEYIDYNIIQYDFHINIIISKNKIQIYHNNQSITIKKLKYGMDKIDL
jgi:hypothetical protein